MRIVEFFLSFAILLRPVPGGSGGSVISLGGWLDSLGRKGLCIFEEVGGSILGLSEPARGV